jgi:hypothetical protein
VSSFEVRYLTLRVFTSNSITFLHFADELIALPSAIFQSSSVSWPNLSLAFPTSCFRFPYDLVGVHWLTSLKFALFSNSICSWKFPDPEQGQAGAWIAIMIIIKLPD